MRTAVPPPQSSEFANLDLLRAVAVLCVFFAHLTDVIAGKQLDVAWHIGRLGVLMFFVHTSLVLMFSLERIPLQGFSLVKAFYIRRAFRIYPLALLCVPVYYFWLPTFLAAARKWTWQDLWANLTLTQNLVLRENVVGVLWSLPLEVQMYICLPVLFLFCRTRSLWWAVGIIGASIPLAVVPSLTTERLNILEYVPCFLAGVIAWRMLRQFESRILPGWVWPLLLAAPAAIWLAAPQEHNLPYRWCCAIALGILIPCCRELSWKPLNRGAHLIAKYSYGIYLVHPAGLFLVYTVAKNHPAVPSALRWLLCMFVVTVVPVLLYHLVEEPLIRVGRKITEPAPVKEPVALAAAAGRA